MEDSLSLECDEKFDMVDVYMDAMVIAPSRIDDYPDTWFGRFTVPISLLYSENDSQVSYNSPSTTKNSVLQPANICAKHDIAREQYTSPLPTTSRCQSQHRTSPQDLKAFYSQTFPRNMSYQPSRRDFGLPKT